MLWDSASDTNYCANEVGQRLKLKGEPFTLVINAITGIKTEIKTMRYCCKMRTRLEAVLMIFYGMERITSIVDSANANDLVKFLPDFSPRLLERPFECDILISQANASLMPSRKCTIDNLVLWDGPKGIVVSGSHKDLNEKCVNYAQSSA